MAKHTKLLSLISAALVLVTCCNYLLPIASVTANTNIVSIPMEDNIQSRDILTEHESGYYYLSAWLGEGTWESPFVPAISKLTNDWSSIDLRDDCTKREGFCLTFSPDLVTDTTLSQITNTLTDDIEDIKWQSIKTVLKANDIKEKKLPNFIHELLKGKIKPGADGKTRIYLGGLIYGEPLPDYTHQTITDNFDRANSSSLGSSSEGWSWTDISGSFGISSSQAIQDYGGGIVSMSRANSDLGSTNMYAQAGTNSDGDVLGVAVRKENNSTATYYCNGYVTPNTVKTYKVTAGSPSLLDGPDAVTYGVGYIIKLQADGSTITTWYNGNMIHNFTDTSITTGQYAGIFAYSANVLLNNFEADALGGVDISNTPSEVDMGVIWGGTTYYAKGTPPNNPVQDSDCTFTITNNGSGNVTLSMSSTNATGGNTWVLVTGVPSGDEFKTVAYYSGQDPASGIALTGESQTFYSDLAPSNTIMWDFSVLLGGDPVTHLMSDGVQHTWTITISGS